LVVRIVFSYFKYKQSSDYTIISHRNPKKKSGFNFGYGGSDFRVLGWDFLGKT